MKKLWILIILISAAVALLNSANFFFGLIQQPPGAVYLGTIHYWEDYFFYLNHFFQGAHGAMLVVNRYTSEAIPPNLNYWSSLVMGAIGGFFGLSPQVNYNLWNILLTFTVLLVSFYVALQFFPQKQLLVFLTFVFSTFATSFMNRIVVNNQAVWYPFEQGWTPNFALDRLGGSPRQLTETLFFYLLSLTILTKTKATLVHYLTGALLSLMLTTLNPIMALILIASAWIFNLGQLALTFFWPTTDRTNQHMISWKILVILTLFCFVGSIVMYRLLTTSQYLQARSWEAAQHVAISIPFFLKSVGPIGILVFIGLVTFFFRPERTLQFNIVLLTLSYGLFLSPLPKIMGLLNARFIFPALYPFIGALATKGTLGLTQLLAKKPFHWSQTITVSLVLGIFLIASVPTLIWEVVQKLTPPQEPMTRMVYLPTDIYQGFTFLQTQPPFEAVVLANPVSRMDLLVPPLSGHTSYTGHPQVTINPEEKNKQAISFFNLSMTPSNALIWLKDKRIRYVVFTQYDGDVAAFHQTYPFLKLIFSERGATVFRVR